MKPNSFWLSVAFCMILYLQMSAAIPSKPSGPDCSLSTFQFCEANPLDILDGPGFILDVPLNLSGLEGFIYDINVYTEIEHTYNDDLEIFLTSPLGTEVTLSTDNGGSSDNGFDGTTWDDDSDEQVTDAVFTDGVAFSSLIPEGALASFNGEIGNGLWTLRIEDDAAMDVGMINAFCIEVTMIDTIPDSTMMTFTNNANTLIPDGPNGVLITSLQVSGMPGNILDLDIQTFIQHTFNSDLDLILRSPSGTDVALSTQNGGNNDNVFNGTLWGDKAEPVTDANYFDNVVNSPLSPEGALGALIGEDPNGTWILTIEDNEFIDIGILNSWSLHIETAQCGSEPIPTLKGWALITLAQLLLITGVISIQTAKSKTRL